MAYGIKVSLPGYDADTDTNLDHFALWASSDDTSDSVLIKEFARGSHDVTPSYTTAYEITHGLGYIPLFFVYCYYQNLNSLIGVPTDKWVQVPHIQMTASIPPFYIYADTDKIYIWNFDGVAAGTETEFKWYIFYDEVVGTDTNTITESDYVIKVSKDGEDASTSTDPNDYIFHSDLNTFKILKEATSSVTYSSDGAYTIAHGLSSYSPTSFLLYLEFPDGYSVMCNGIGRTASRDGNFVVTGVYIDSTNVGFYLSRSGGSGTALKAKYLIFETPL